MNIMTKKNWLALLLTILVLSSLWLMRLKYKPISFSSFTLEESKNFFSDLLKPLALPSPSIKPVGLPPEQTPDFTGAAAETRDKPTNLKQYEFDVLVNHTPIVQSEFTITVDYRQDKLIVELKTPKAASRNSFDSWLKENGYELITANQIIFQ